MHDKQTPRFFLGFTRARKSTSWAGGSARSCTSGGRASWCGPPRPLFPFRHLRPSGAEPSGLLGYFPLRPICPSPSRVFACGVCLEPRERCEVRALRSACLAIRAERVAAAHARVREPCRAGPHGRGQAVGCSRRGQARLGLARLSGLKRAEKKAGMAARGLAARPRSAAQGKGGR